MLIPVSKLTAMQIVRLSGRTCDWCARPFSVHSYAGWGYERETNVLLCHICNNSREEEEMSITPAKKGFTFGCDPEVFIVNTEGGLVSAAGLLPGTKEEPFKVEDGWVQVDGMAGEFNIEPVTDFDEFHRKINSVMGQMKAMLPKGYGFSIVPSVEFPQEVYDAAPDSAKELGCCPDFNAWTGDVNLPPDVSAHPRLRTAAGHIHIGWLPEGADAFSLDDPQHIMNCQDLAKQLDWYLGGWSLKVDTDSKRRLLYGKAGAIRYKPYGVEYRVLSNFWLTSKMTRLAVWNRMQTAINDMSKHFLPEHYDRVYSKLLVDSIDRSEMDETLRRSCSFPLISLNRYN